MINVMELVSKSKTIVVKVGTSTITHENGNLNLYIIEKLVRVLSDLRNQGRNIVLVTSGAIGVGRAKMGLTKRPSTIMEKQALAAIGQVSLMHIYSKIFSEYGLTASQVLLTKDVVEDEERCKNSYNTFSTLLGYGAIPIVNENDTVSTEEIEFGDNDTLSAVVASLVKANLLILLSDIDGLYDKNPKLFSDAKLIRMVNFIDSSIQEMSQDTNNSFGTGGMRTKISAASICMEKGIPMIITNGDEPDNISRIIRGEKIGTLFFPKERER